MRELVYLSERKLRAFQQERKRGFRVREIGVPGVGQVGVEPPADSHLDDVIEYLGGIARWYQEDGVSAGEWVQFETTLSYTVLQPEDLAPYLIFAEPPGGRRLFLHGSPDHLLGSPTPPAVQLPTMVSQGPAMRLLIAALVKSPVRSPRLDDISDRIGELFDPDVAASMTGFARVTSTAYDAVVASPLFVAYARQ